MLLAVDQVPTAEVAFLCGAGSTPTTIPPRWRSSLDYLYHLLIFARVPRDGGRERTAAPSLCLLYYIHCNNTVVTATKRTAVTRFGGLLVRYQYAANYIMRLVDWFSSGLRCLRTPSRWHSYACALYAWVLRFASIHPVSCCEHVEGQPNTLICHILIAQYIHIGHKDVRDRWNKTWSNPEGMNPLECFLVLISLQQALGGRVMGVRVEAGLEWAVPGDGEESVGGR